MDSEILELKSRLGVLATMNPYSPDGLYELDLRVFDQRKVALMLVWLADGEPGENWQEESLDGRALDITTVWLTDEGMPKKGIMRLRYVTNLECAIPKLRSMLAAECAAVPTSAALCVSAAMETAGAFQHIPPVQSCDSYGTALERGSAPQCVCVRESFIPKNITREGQPQTVV